MIYDVVAIGESLIDVIVKYDGCALTMEGNPGGAPLNVLAAGAKLGLDAAFIGKISTDAFGECLLDTIKRSGVSEEGAVITSSEPTTLAIVTLDPVGDRNFSFYRNGTADVMLESGELNLDLIGRCRVFHFGSVSMTAEPSRSATLAAAKYAGERGATVSYDPNLRERLWKDLSEAKDVILEGMGLADVAKVSEEELSFLTGTEDLEAGAVGLCRRYGLKILTVTMGAEGAAVTEGDKLVWRPTYTVSTVDTTGAGDTFWGAFLYCLIKGGKAPERYSSEELEKFLDFANAAGSLCTTKKGAIPAMPDLKQVKELAGTAI